MNRFGQYGSMLLVAVNLAARAQAATVPIAQWFEAESFSDTHGVSFPPIGAAGDQWNRTLLKECGEGEVIPGRVDRYAGKAPDLGAYEYGEPRWVPGADWEEHEWHYPPSDNVLPICAGASTNASAAQPVSIACTMNHLVVSGIPQDHYSMWIHDMRGAVVMHTSGILEKPAALNLDFRTLAPATYIATCRAGNRVVTQRIPAGLQPFPHRHER